MPHDPIIRWENEGGAVLFANGAEHDPPRDEGEAEVNQPRAHEGSERRDADARPDQARRALLVGQPTASPHSAMCWRSLRRASCSVL